MENRWSDFLTGMKLVNDRGRMSDVTVPAPRVTVRAHLFQMGPEFPVAVVMN